MATLSAYCYCNRAEQMDMPYAESILSMSVACPDGEVVVVSDERFEDGTMEKLRQLERQANNVRVVPHEWDLSEPGADGLEKAFARSQTRGDVLMPFDVDEIVRKADGPKLRVIADDMHARQIWIMSCGTLNWANGKHIKWAEPCIKPRLTLKEDAITHGIPSHCKLNYPNNRIHSSKESDGAGLIHKSRGVGLDGDIAFSSPGNITADDVNNPDPNELGILAKSLKNRNHIWIDHLSWYDFPRKWGMGPVWDYLWMHLHGELPGGLPDYKTNRDKMPLEHDFMDCSWSLPTRGKDEYTGTVADEMSKGKVLRLEWHSLPKEAEDWINSPRRFTYGTMEAEVPEPSAWDDRKAWVRKYILRRRDFDY